MPGGECARARPAEIGACFSEQRIRSQGDEVVRTGLNQKAAVKFLEVKGNRKEQCDTRRVPIRKGPGETAGEIARQIVAIKIKANDIVLWNNLAQKTFARWSEREGGGGERGTRGLMQKVGVMQERQDNETFISTTKPWSRGGGEGSSMV